MWFRNGKWCERPAALGLGYYGAAATLAGLLDNITVEWICRMREDAHIRMNISQMTVYSLKAGYKYWNATDDDVDIFTSSLSEFKAACTERLQHEFKKRKMQNASSKEANLRMKLVVGLKYKQAKVNMRIVSDGVKRWGHVVAVKCSIVKKGRKDRKGHDDEAILEFDDKGNIKVSLCVLDYRDNPSGKQVQLPPESEIESYWSLLPIFYYSK